VSLEIDAFDSCRLRPRHVKNQTARDDEHRHRRHSPRLHINLVPASQIRESRPSNWPRVLEPHDTTRAEANLLDDRIADARDFLAVVVVGLDPLMHVRSRRAIDHDQLEVLTSGSDLLRGLDERKVRVVRN
jgi:hypothetical protein